MILKICGMRDAANIRDVEALGIDWLGMIFWPKSPRYVGAVPAGSGIATDGKSRTTEGNTKTVKRVGVFVNETIRNIITHVTDYNLDIIQLHGNETPDMIGDLRAELNNSKRHGTIIIKAISVTSTEDLERCRDYEDSVDYFLFDTRCTTVGGSGRQFDWSVLDAYTGRRPFLLSGGIGPDDVDRIKSLSHPMFAGIDLNSRFETEPGMKDVEALRGFISKIRENR